jgi:hypothetical protein
MMSSSRRYAAPGGYDPYYGGGRRRSTVYDNEVDFLTPDYGRGATSGPIIRNGRGLRSRSVERDIIIDRNGNEEIIETVTSNSSPRMRSRAVEIDDDLFNRRGYRRQSRGGYRGDLVDEEVITEIRRDDGTTEVIDDRIRRRSRSRGRNYSRNDTEEVTVTRTVSPRGQDVIEEVTVNNGMGPSTTTTIIDNGQQDSFNKAPIRQEIHQEIITHHRHIDHGVQRSNNYISPLSMGDMNMGMNMNTGVTTTTTTPIIEADGTRAVDIRETDSMGNTISEEVIVEGTLNTPGAQNLALGRRRSMSGFYSRNRNYDDDDSSDEGDFYNARALDRSYPGEAVNGVTQSWNIVDVPPGTERVRLDGVAGSTQEITWQKFNGVRRSKLYTPDGSVYDSGYGNGNGLQTMNGRGRSGEMWTEITRDLVSRDALTMMGYEYEETEFFFYVMEYLNYVSSLSSLSYSQTDKI